MKKYEYREWASDGPETNLHLMNELGAEGWHIFQVTFNVSRVYYIAARLVTDAS